ncbi:MAG: aconitate hydratase AcnA [Bacteroidetes bacterium]|nr:aconitate hydratase AcnA [Bacteroidota bacterium]
MRIGAKTISYFSLPALEQALGVHLWRLPVSLRILLENLLRCEDGNAVRKEDIENLARWDPNSISDKEIAFMPARVLLQDFTGVPCIVDLALMRDAMVMMGGDPDKINPLQPVDLVIDHSVQVDEYGAPDAFQKNTQLEFKRNQERYAFLRWGQQAFRNFRVVPPSTGIVHQINLEYLARIVFSSEENGSPIAFPDTVVGTDSHTTMINGLGVLGWGVGGIEAEAAMLGQPISMLIPQVVGFKLHGKLKPGSTSTDLVLTITQMLRKKGVVGKFIEFYGPGLPSLSLADRATIANMAPEYGATMGFFPVDSETINFLRLTGRSEEQIALTEMYFKEQRLFNTPETDEPDFSDIVELNLATVEPSIAGPKRPQERVSLPRTKASFRSSLVEILESKGVAIDKLAIATWVHYSDDSIKPNFLKNADIEINGQKHTLKHGSVVIAAITSCTNTSNPSVLITAGLLAKKALEKGLASKPWVKTSLAPGSKVVTEYLKSAGLMQPLESLGFHLVGYGCTTCIGNSGPLPEIITKAIYENELIAAAVLSGNRNFEGRINPHTRVNYLASPPLVVAFALAGTVDINFAKEPVGTGSDGEPVFLKDIWPAPEEVEQIMRQSLRPDMFKQAYSKVFEGDNNWTNLPVPTGIQYAWDTDSTYIKAAPYFENFSREPKPLQNIRNARVLALLGDSVTTDHISPAGSFGENTPAGNYLMFLGIRKKDFNQYGARRGNHEIMMRGTFANTHLKNLLIPGTEGGFTIHPSSKEPISIYSAAMKYKDDGVPMIVIAGKEYGSGSSRDWAAKGPALLGVKAIMAGSFERIHRSNLIGMGILPLQFEDGETCQSLGLTGFETFDIEGLADDLKPKKKIKVTATTQSGVKGTFNVICRIDTPNELEYYKHSGILQYVLRSMLKSEAPSINQQKKVVTEAKTQKYRILFNGEIEPGLDAAVVKERLAKLFKTTPEQVNKLFTGRPVTVNNNLDFSAAQQYITLMKNEGALCYFEPMKIAPPPQVNSIPGDVQQGKAPKPVTAAKPPAAALSKSKTAPKTEQAVDLKSPLHILGLTATTTGMMLLFSLYFFVVLYLATETFVNIFDRTHLFSNEDFIPAFLLYFTPIILGIILLIAMIKPIIAKPAVKSAPVVLARNKEQAIYSFVGKLCQSIGAKMPSSIEVDCSTQACAQFKQGFVGFLEDQTTLIIGLPAASELTTTEFTSVVAHELSHFMDKLGMRFYHIMTSIKRWFFKRIYAEDNLDQKLTVMTMTSDGIVRWIILPILNLSVWLSRQILTAFYFMCSIAGKYYLRQMEFNADKYAARFSGVESFESSLSKVQQLDVASKKALSQLKTQSRPEDNSLPNDFVRLVISSMKQKSDEATIKAKADALKNLRKMPEKDPTDKERIEKVRALPLKPVQPSDTPASTLFANFGELSKITSSRYYKDVLGLQFDKGSLIPTDEFITATEEAPPPPEDQIEIDINNL